MSVRKHLQNAVNEVMLAIAQSNSRDNDELHPLHGEKLNEVHESLVSILRSVHAREMLGAKIPDMEHEDRGEQAAENALGGNTQYVDCGPEEIDIERKK